MLLKGAGAHYVATLQHPSLERQSNRPRLLPWRRRFVAIRQRADPLRPPRRSSCRRCHLQCLDFGARMATADLEPVPVDAWRPWFRDFDPRRWPLGALQHRDGLTPCALLSLQSFYGRPAYHAAARWRSTRHERPSLRACTNVPAPRDRDGSCAGAANVTRVRIREIATRAIALFAAQRFERWGLLPRAAELDGAERDLAILGLRVATSTP